MVSMKKYNGFEKKCQRLVRAFLRSFCLILLLGGFAFSLSACGQRVPLSPSEEPVQDTLSY